jgi:putative pyruvate formate lyase activating enzyme
LSQFSSLFQRTCTFAPRVTKRSHGIPPQYLLDDYIPRYQLLKEVDAAKKRSLAYAHLRNCNLCPRLCGVNRYERTGLCLIGAETVKVNVIAPHRGEEPCIQGYNGSGSVFFSGCNLRCVFCQNHVCIMLGSLSPMLKPTTYIHISIDHMDAFRISPTSGTDLI